MHNYFVLTGPTAAGKTAWLVSRARSAPITAISADSRQAYRYMNIGTGKPSPSEQQILPHYGLDCVEPGINHSVYQFLTITAESLRLARLKQQQVWVCGGAGLYIRALVQKLQLGQPPRPLLRRAVEHKMAGQSARAIAEQFMLAVTDPDNPVRIIRALEQQCSERNAREAIYAWCGLSVQAAEQDSAASLQHREAAELSELEQWQCAGIAVLDPGKALLAEQIALRVRGMFEQGLVEEVRSLRALGYGAASVVANGIGYREGGAVLDGLQDYEEAISQTITRTCQYAKRQRTYFRSQAWPVLTEPELEAWAATIARLSDPG